MSRSGYTDDYEYPNIYRASVDRSLHGARGQHFLRKLRDALDAMPRKRLITNAIKDDAGEVCALGAVDPDFKGYDAEDLAAHFGIARAMAAEIVYMNDEIPYSSETPEQRWTRMRAWVSAQLRAEYEPDGQA
jgi:hypothetical protein